MKKEDLQALARERMPFGKYQGYLLIDLPEEYLLWFARKEAFPSGKLGEWMALALLVKSEGLTQLVAPLKNR